MLKEMTREIVEEVNEMKDLIMKQCTIDMFINMGAEELLIIKKTVDLADKTMKLAIAQAEMMDNINEKLDKLLAK